MAEAAFEAQKAAALALLESKGIGRLNYAPPLLRLLWKAGMRVRPPHFAAWWSTATYMGVFFGTGWGALMWVLQWKAQGIPRAGIAVMVLTAGAAFGMAMATYYAHERKKFGLPEWSELGS